MSTIYSVRVIDLSNLLDPNIVELLMENPPDNSSFGDNELSLVKPDKVQGWLSNIDDEDLEFHSVEKWEIDEALATLDKVEEEVYINIE